MLPKSNPEQVLPKDSPIEEPDTQDVVREEIPTGDIIFEQNILKENPTYDVPPTKLITESQVTSMGIGKLKHELVMAEIEMINDELTRIKKCLSENKDQQSKKI